VLPSGVIAMAEGLLPTVIGAPAVLVAIVIGVTVPDPCPVPATYAVFPSGVIAIALGYPPSAIGAPAVPVAVVIGVTVPEPEFAT
jgi:hypothetical protein